MLRNSTEKRRRGTQSRPEPEPLVTEPQLQKLVEAISNSQHNYRELIDHLDLAVFTLSLEGEIRVANRRMAQILGVGFQELIGRRINDFVDVPAIGDLRYAITELSQKGGWTGTKSLILKKTGEQRRFSCCLHGVIEGGEMISIVGWVRDVTEGHQSEIRFSELLDSLRGAIFFSSVDGKILDANTAMVRMLGYESKKELQEVDFRDIYADPLERDMVIAEFRETGSLNGRRVMFRRKSGEPVLCLASGISICDSSGRILYFQGMLVDITEHLEIEKQLYQEQEFVRRLVASFPDMIAVLDCDGRFTFASQRTQEVLGRSPRHYIGQTLESQTNAEDREQLSKMFRSLTGGRASHGSAEIRMQAADGSLKYLRLSACPLFDERGAITGVVASARDVTESRLADEQVAQSEKFAAMGRMMTGAAHELNNPLTAILGVGELLRERATDEGTRRHLDLVLQQTRRAASIVQSLTAFSRPQTQMRTRMRPEEVVQEALNAQRALFAEKNILATVDPGRDLPAIEADRKLLLQVFSHIITNAVQSIAATKDRGVLQVSVERVDDKIRITFADDGAGIPPENLSKIFDPFFTTKRPGGGSGLGLTIARAIVKEHGGSIEAQSTPNAGASLSVCLPATKETEAGIPEFATRADSATAVADSHGSSFSGSSSASGRPGSGSEGIRGRKVLVVDDEESICEIVEMGLAERGMKVHCATMPEDALDYLEKESCDVVLCDFNLPGMNGEAMFEKFRQTAGDTVPKFIFMTGELLDDTAIQHFAQKGAAVLQKPFQIATLVALVAQALETQPVNIG